MSMASRIALVVGAVAGLAGLAACTGAAPAPDPPPGSSAPGVIVPGRPGESNRIVPPDQASAPDGNAYNDSDVWFVRAMIPHHAQALKMTDMARSRAGNQQIRAVAERITVAQEGEIAQLRAWLKARGLDERLGHQDHAAMRGMQGAAALRALAAATGAGFDRMFVDMMSDHHRGAIDMATRVLGSGRNEQIEQLAAEISAEQASEITRMRDALTG
jgi:uncharacterized protein (DUF305 family)